MNWIILFMILLTLTMVILVSSLGLKMGVSGQTLLSEFNEVEFIVIPDQIPASVKRFYQAVYGSNIPKTSTAEVWGRGISSLIELPFLGHIMVPIRWKCYVRSGEEFFWDTEMYWFKKPCIRCEDAYIGGQGRQRIGKKTTQGRKMNLSQYPILWACTILCSPASLLEREDLLWTEINEYTVGLAIYAQERDWFLTLIFDPETHLLIQVETVRYNEKAENFSLYRMVFDNYRDFQGRFLPERLGAAWGESFHVFYEIEGYATNRNISEKLM